MLNAPRNLETPVRNWTSVEHYSYPDRVPGIRDGEEIQVVVPNETYRIDDSGLYVQRISETSYRTSFPARLSAIRRFHRGYIYDHHDLQVTVNESEGSSSLVEIDVAGWLSKINQLGDIGIDHIKFNKEYSRDRDEYPGLKYTWEEWITQRDAAST
jgi:hypothetical protein